MCWDTKRKYILLNITATNLMVKIFACWGVCLLREGGIFWVVFSWDVAVGWEVMGSLQLGCCCRLRGTAPLPAQLSRELAALQRSYGVKIQQCSDYWWNLFPPGKLYFITNVSVGKNWSQVNLAQLKVSVEGYETIAQGGSGCTSADGLHWLKSLHKAYTEKEMLI